MSGLLPYSEAVKFLDSDAMTHYVITKAKEANNGGLSVPHLSIQTTHTDVDGNEVKSDWMEMAGVPQETDLTDLLLSMSTSTSTSTSQGLLNSSDIGQCSNITSDDDSLNSSNQDNIGSFYNEAVDNVMVASEADRRAAVKYEWRSENLLGAMLEAMPDGWPQEMPFDESHFSRFDSTRLAVVVSS